MTKLISRPLSVTLGEFIAVPLFVGIAPVPGRVRGTG